MFCQEKKGKLRKVPVEKNKLQTLRKGKEMRKKSAYEKYTKIQEKYQEKIRDLAIKYSKELEKALNVEVTQHFFNKSGYLHLSIDGIGFQAGGFETYFYSTEINLSDYLFARGEIKDEI